MTPGGAMGGLPMLRSPEEMSAPVLQPEQGDPEHCGNCRFFEPATSYCLRHPPVGQQWSRVTEDQWCGEYEAGEPHQPHMDSTEPGEITEEDQQMSGGGLGV